MASTRAGRIATDAHRRRQVALATAADSQIRRAWSLLDVADIDVGRAAFQQRMVAIVAQYHQVSQIQAEQYLARFRLAEIGQALGPVVKPGLDLAATALAVDSSGPRALKRRIGQGVPPPAAYMQQRGILMAETRKRIMAGGRGVVRESGRADGRATGWRRVSDGDPCTFCAMLVSRGPAYTTEAKALAKGNEDPYHTHCGCSVEIVYGDWVPTELEQEWVDAYFEAAEEATAEDGVRTAETVLHRMRAKGDFGDSPARRNVVAPD